MGCAFIAIIFASCYLFFQAYDSANASEAAALAGFGVAVMVLGCAVMVHDSLLVAIKKERKDA